MMLNITFTLAGDITAIPSVHQKFAMPTNMFPINHFGCNVFSIETAQNHIEACAFLPLHAGKTHRC